MQKRRCVRRWFSLIELLIVIAILAVLISLLLPALKKARDSASAMVCLGNVRTYGFKYMEFIDTTDGVFQLMTNKSEKDYFFPSNDRTAHACPLDDIPRQLNSIWGATPLLPISYAINGHLVGYVKLDPQTGFMSWVSSESDFVPPENTADPLHLPDDSLRRIYTLDRQCVDPESNQYGDQIQSEIPVPTPLHPPLYDLQRFQPGVGEIRS